jgi:hypothetical protein
VIFGLIFALAAACATGSGSVVQALAARRAAAHAGGTGGARELGRLVVSPLYLSGVSLDGLGFVGIVAALHWLPLFMVQCAGASSVGVTALIGRRVLRTTLGRRQLVALGGLGVGLVLLAAGAKPQAATALARSDQWWFVVLTVPVIVAGLLASRGSSARAGGMLAAIAGLAFAGTGIAARVLSAARSWPVVFRSPVTYALVVFGIVGMLFFAAALQRAAVTIATAASFGIETLTGSAVGLLLLGDSTRPGFAASTAAGFVITLTSAVVLALSGDLEAAVVSENGGSRGRAQPVPADS